MRMHPVLRVFVVIALIGVVAVIAVFASVGAWMRRRAVRAAHARPRGPRLRWFERLGAYLAARGRDTVILTRDGGRPYLHRHYVTGRRLGGLVSVCLHHFLASDEDFWHDHPWPYLTIVLGGGYWELMPDGRKEWRRPGSVMFRSARSAHMVELDPRRGPCWTMFIMGPRVRPREWGFRTSRGWVQWQQYLDLRDKIGLRPKTVGERPLPRPTMATTIMRFGPRP